jgi:hypothetical protein
VAIRPRHVSSRGQGDVYVLNLIPFREKQAITGQTMSGRFRLRQKPLDEFIAILSCAATKLGKTQDAILKGLNEAQIGRKEI